MKILLNIFVFFVIIGQIDLPAQNLLTRQAPLPCLNKKFTIIAHIVRDSFGNDGITEGQITTGIEGLNGHFEPICASFEVCEFRYIDNFQYDFVDGNDWEEMQVKFHQANRINMFFVTDIGDVNAVCGFATVGGVAMTQRGGIVIKKECMTPDSKTTSHEMGHYFSLLHTFEGNGSELVNGTNCDSEGDLICDTPADPYEIGDPLDQYIDVGNGCRFISGKVDANGEFYIPDVGNIMSYYPNDCRCGFTYGQYLQMANTYLGSNPKLW